jgi:hypothetical protein
MAKEYLERHRKEDESSNEEFILEEGLLVLTQTPALKVQGQFILKNTSVAKKV